MKKHEVAKKMKGWEKSLKHENISYGELAEMGKYKKHIIKSGNVRLAEAAGIPEHEFNRSRHPKQKGKGSLTTPKGEHNEGEKHYLGKRGNEEQPA